MAVSPFLLFAKKPTGFSPIQFKPGYGSQVDKATSAENLKFNWEETGPGDFRNCPVMVKLRGRTGLGGVMTLLNVDWVNTNENRANEICLCN